MTAEELERRLRITYATALKSQHAGARIQIHISDDVKEAMRTFVEGVAAFNWGVGAVSAWGYPIVVDERLPADTIQVHSVTSIY